MSEKKEIEVVEYPTYYEIAPTVKIIKIDSFNALQFRDMILEGHSDKNIKLDLNNVEYLDSAAVGVLLEIGKKFNKKGLKVYICNAYAASHLMKLLNLHTFFALSEDEIMTLPES